MPKPQLIMMARWPSIGQGKTRLAASTSPARAVQFQRHSLTILINRLGGHGVWDFSLALTPTESWRRAKHHRLTRGIDLMAQGGGDLGARMQRLMNTSSRQSPPARRPVIIIGSDTPTVATTDIRDSLRALQRHDLVFGPSNDGGYWLFGWSGRPIRAGAHHLPALTNIRWSQEHALADTIQCLRQKADRPLKIVLLRSRIDIDDRADLIAIGPLRRSGNGKTLAERRSQPTR